MTREQLFRLHETACKKARSLMRDKNADYAFGEDALENFRQFGGVGILARASDKLSRLKKVAIGGKYVVSEPPEEVILDILNYAILFLAYMQDTQDARGKRCTK